MSFPQGGAKRLCLDNEAGLFLWILATRTESFPRLKRRKATVWWRLTLDSSFLSKFICPLLTGEFPVKRLMFSQTFHMWMYSCQSSPGGQCFRTYTEDSRGKSGDPEPGIRYHPLPYRRPTAGKAHLSVSQHQGACHLGALRLTPSSQGATDEKYTARVSLAWILLYTCHHLDGLKAGRIERQS